MVGDLDKSTTQCYQGRPTTAARSRVCVASVYVSRDTSAVNRQHDRAMRM